MKLLADDPGIGRSVIVEHEVHMCGQGKEQARSKKCTACIADAKVRSVVSRTAATDDSARGKQDGSLNRRVAEVAAAALERVSRGWSRAVLGMVEHHMVTTSPTGRPEVARVALTPASVRTRLADDPGTTLPSLNDRTVVVVDPPANAVSALVPIMAAATMLPANILTASSFDL